MFSSFSHKTPQGNPDEMPASGTYKTQGGIEVHRRVVPVANSQDQMEALTHRLDQELGVVLLSSYEFPGRYSRWSIGFVQPPLMLEFFGDTSFRLSGLTPAGQSLLPVLHHHFETTQWIIELKRSPNMLLGKLASKAAFFTEEERSKQTSALSLVRTLRDFFQPEDPAEDSRHLGLYGSFGYDLACSFADVQKQLEAGQRSMVLFVPDKILVADISKDVSWELTYEFEVEQQSIPQPLQILSPSTLPSGSTQYVFDSRVESPRDTQPSEFESLVNTAKEAFHRGDAFEVVLSQAFFRPLKCLPSQVFHKLVKKNPAPFLFYMNLGNAEKLVGASPEIFVRVERQGDHLRIETCPISGTIQRGTNALEDAKMVQKLLSDAKEEAELTMCTDVDRNDKSRICVPGSVKVIGRRQIEMYSKLIHTVDHVEGLLSPEYDAVDAFLTHAWAVTVTGAPKKAAMHMIEASEKGHRRWYGGAVGFFGFDGCLNTGLTLRTIQIRENLCEVRAGATLLLDSIPENEQAETVLKAKALIEVLEDSDTVQSLPERQIEELDSFQGIRLCLVDFEDSFVFTLGNYLKSLGAQVTTIEWQRLNQLLAAQSFDGFVLSPGPFSPEHFGMSVILDRLLGLAKPILGICLGMQGLIQYFGGRLGQLREPVHGKPGMCVVHQKGGSLFEKLPAEFVVGRYHSLVNLGGTLAAPLKVTALTRDKEIYSSFPDSGEFGKSQIVLGLEHESLPIFGVQFHPESMITGMHDGLHLLKAFLRVCQA